MSQPVSSLKFQICHVTMILHLQAFSHLLVLPHVQFKGIVHPKISLLLSSYLCANEKSGDVSFIQKTY